MKFRHLFNPISIGKMQLQNRIAMPSINHGYSEDGQVNDRLVAYYAARAKGGAGLITLGGCAVHPLGRSFRIICIYDDTFNAGLKKLTEAVHEYDSKIVAQLYHAGGYAKSREIGAQAVAPSALPNKYTHETPKEMTAEDIEIARNSFIDAAKRAKQVGFDGVEIIGSAGYLIAEFLSPYTNHRTDEYGGAWENRSRFLVEVISGIHDKVGADFPVIVRLSGNDFVKDGNTNANAVRLAKVLEDNGADAINVTGGWHESKIPQTTGELPTGGYTYLAANIKKAVHIPVIASNRINDPVEAERIIAFGFADMVNMGRALLADPDLPNKAQAGSVKEIRRCIACGQGCYDRRFSGQDVCCMINYTTGRENELVKQPAPSPKRVLVIGGGVAGMEFAINAAERGHKITLWEKSNRLGGQLNYAAKPIGKHDFKYLLEYQTYMLEKHAVNVVLAKEATVDEVLAFQPDAVVVAMGSEPIKAPFAVESDGGNIVQANDVLAGEYIPGQNVVVVGGGAVGCETAIFLADQGTLSAEQTKFLMLHKAESDEVIHALLEQGTRKVTIVEMFKEVGKDIGVSTRWGVKKHITQLGIHCLTETKVIAVTDQGVRVQLPSGEIETMEADTIVLAIGSRPRDTLSKELTGKIKEVYVIGDAVTPGKIFSCITDAVELGLRI
jgi:2,4-dienoyl-CoA reductase (NADPH2)